jgi:hypothetical protein
VQVFIYFPMLLQFLIATCSALTRQTIWKFNECTGSPNAIYTFPDSNPTTSYQLRANESEIEYCGKYQRAKPLERLEDCCHSSTILSKTRFQSFTIEVKSNEIDLSFSKLANGQEYCFFRALDGISLSGRLDSFYSSLPAEQNNCIDGVICTTNNVYIYPSLECKGKPEVFEATNTPRILKSSILGNVEMYRTKIQNGTSSTVWTNYFPMKYFHPLNVYPLEIIGTYASCQNIVLMFLASLFYTRKNLLNTNSNLLMPIVCLSSMLLFSLNMLNMYLIVDSDVLVVALHQLEDVSSNLLTGFITFVNIRNLLVVVAKYSAITRIMTYFTVLMAHIALAGGRYIGEIENSNFILRWRLLSNYWELLMILLNSLICFRIAVYMVYLDSKKRKCQKIDSILAFMQDVNLKIIIFGQLTCTVLYYSFYIIRAYTVFLKNDRNWYAFKGIFSCILSFHVLLTLLTWVVEKFANFHFFHYIQYFVFPPPAFKRS